MADRRIGSFGQGGGIRRWLLALCVLNTVAVGCQRAAAGPVTLHYAANDNVTASGGYPPGRLGFTLADVSTRADLDALPGGVRGLVYVGTCAGADPAFTSTVDQFAGDRRLYGFYLIDEPAPATCPAPALRAESDYVHAHLPGAITFIVAQNLASARTPSFAGGYDPADTGIDLFGLDPYPCRTELAGCDDAMIDRYVAAAQRAGIPITDVVPVYQAFGGGSWVDDGGGGYLLPTAEQATALLADWHRLVPAPPFDFAYSWGVQRGDTALSTAGAALADVFAAHNHGR